MAVMASVAMVAMSWSAGGVPIGWVPPLVLPAQLIYSVALITYCIVWLEFGCRLFVDETGADAGVLVRLVFWTTTPFLLAAPFGRDLAAYAAQGNVVGHGLDPYRHAPSSVPGVFTAQVGHRWLDSVAPYGPAWLRISQFAVWLSHAHPLLAELLLRVPAYVGVLLCVWALPRLAQRLNGKLVRALWLGLASPLVLVLGVGGGHNDMLMMGLALAGLAIASRPSWQHLVAGAAVVGVAVMIKSPAVVVLAFTVPVWVAANREPDIAPPTLLKVLAACVATLGASAMAVGFCQVAGGLGWGWARQVDSDPGFNSPFSLPSAMVLLVRTISGRGAPPSHDTALHIARTIGVIIAAIVVVTLWALAVQRARLRCDTSVLGRLAGALFVLAVLAPLVQPWYYSWALLLAGFAIVRRGPLMITTALAVLLTAMILPSGQGWLGSWGALVIAPVALALSFVMLGGRERRSAIL